MLSNLTAITGPSPNYIPFAKTPTHTTSNIPAGLNNIQLLGWDPRNPSSVVGFTVSWDAGYAAAVSLDRPPSDIVVDVTVDPHSAAGSAEYTIDMGVRAKATKWTLPFNLPLPAAGNTGTWVFAKAKVGDNEYAPSI